MAVRDCVLRVSRPLAAVLLATVFLAMAFVPAAQAQESRQQRFADNLEHVQVLQNLDGGFGDVATRDGGSAYATASSSDSLVETVFTIELLLDEGTDPLAVIENWQGQRTSLAASSVPNALAWLQRYESEVGDRSEVASGELVLAALAYDRLDDEANAQRLVRDTVRLAHDEPDLFDGRGLARLAFVGGEIDVRFTNETLNTTWSGLLEEVDGASFEADARALAWATLADPLHEAHRSALADRASRAIAAGEEGRPLPKDDLALVSWALARSALLAPFDVERTDAREDANLTVAAVDHLYERVPYNEARAWTMLAEVLMFPYVSALAPESTAGVGLDVGAGRGSEESLDLGLPSTGPEEGPSDGARAVPDDPAAFPLPTWVVAAVGALALVAISIVALAYGLKKEDLQGLRKDIFEYIEKNPGEHFSKIRREVGLAPGTFQHHLNNLETEGCITSFKEARYKRYFVNGNRYQTLIKGKTTEEYKGKFAALKNDTSREVVRYLRNNPGATQKQVAERLALHASTVNWHARRLRQVGILNHEKVGKEVRYSVDEETVGKLIGR